MDIDSLPPVPDSKEPPPPMPKLEREKSKVSFVEPEVEPRRSSDMEPSRKSSESKDRPVPVLVVKKKQKKKSWLGISGYQDMEKPANDSGETYESSEAYGTNLMKESTQTSPIRAPASNPSESTLSCEPIYTIELLGNKYVLDLQLGLHLGYTSGRAITDKYPKIRKMIASAPQKSALEISPISEHVFKFMLQKYGDGTEESCKWIKSVSTRTGGKGMKLSDVDIQFLLFDDVVKEVKDMSVSKTESFDLIVDDAPVEETKIEEPKEEKRPAPVSSGGILHKLKKLRPN